MVMRLISLFVLLPLFLFSGEFHASVSRNSVSLGEGFTLNLTLKEASAKTSPSIDELNKIFLIHSQQQASNTVITNGKFTSSVTWKLVLIPQKEGEFTIPAINIDTSEGILSSDPIKIQVIKASATSNPNGENTEGIILVTEVKTTKPYKNEPFFYTVRLTSKQSLANIQMQKMNVEEAIVEVVGEPVIFDKVVEGMRVGVIEFSYLITPLKNGPLKIPSTIIQGGILIKKTNRMRSFFDDAFDTFSHMQGFDHLKPFAMATEETVVEVQPPVADLVPWMPAKSFAIKEIWNDSQSLQVGEFFTRGFEIVAEGIHSSQLPSLEGQQVNDGQFKIYADKPELADEIKEGNIKSFRKELYTLIPQQPGLLTLPEISVSWWDVVKNEKVTARIPARTLNVLPAKDHVVSHPLVSINEEVKALQEPAQVVHFQMSPILYAVIAGLVILLVAAIIWGILLQQKMRRLLAVPKSKQPISKTVGAPQVKKNIPNVLEKVKKPSQSKNEKLNDLNPT